MTGDQKVQYVTGTLFPMLENDLETILEARCPRHGTPGRGGPNFAACLMSLLACELAGNLSRKPDVTNPEAVRAFLRRVGELAGDSRYAEVAGPLFGLFRHGIAHTFLPQTHNEVIGSAVWTDDCPQWLDSNEGAQRCAEVRRTVHLNPRRVGDRVALRVVPQILYLDVRRALRDFAQALQAGTFDMPLFAKNFDTWSAWSIEKRYVTSSEENALTHDRSGTPVQRGDFSHGRTETAGAHLVDSLLP